MRRRRSREPQRCIVSGCGAGIPHWKRLCDGHFRQLPFDQRKAIAEAGEARAPHRVVQLAREAAAWLQAHAPAAQAARITGERADG